MATGVFSPGRARLTRRTLREDRWWVQPLITLVVLVGFIVYATWRAFMAKYYVSGPYLSPFYSPCLLESCEEGANHFGVALPLENVPFISPALIILVFPLGFRLTCYYYRKAYYRSIWMSPPACAVAEPHRRYSGESRFPLVFQNAHRWFLYAALVFNVLLTWDFILGFRNDDLEWGHMGLGTLVLGANALLLWLYSLSCHSCRHAVGGRINSFSKHPLRYRMWTLVSRMNAHHPVYAWLSLFGVALTDLYIYLLANGTITDPRFF